MDKIKWLKVVKDELAILEQLAIGMIEDENLTKEEVDLAISRSKIVVMEFEMLLKQVSIPQTDVPVEQPIAMEESIFELEDASFIPDIEPVQPEVPELSIPVSPGPALAVPPETQPKASFYQQVAEDRPVVNLDESKEETSKFKPTPLKSLKEGLNLNDRYLFQRELFNNDKSRLDSTIATLDQLANIQEAVEYLKANFVWTKSEASEKFIFLVKRRFTV